ncbi:hypothetical protein BDV95DRAFT_245561 [Massariosphaeria phaeospora]|uniref:Methyltransferase domain-containing protein n=1 Tax=Massariosphaeria phaeospora TaxID=100035 RepID=A0A7C8HZ18_9PLEO|nr:hypothetical protein BDV95DRAFT_245561 [Massariosphaeria phaeospora]
MDSDLERKRLASNHYIAKDAAGGKLVLAPVNFTQPVKVLDSTTADGTWLLDLATDLLTAPDGAAHVFVGTDINPVPFPAQPPSNFAFHVQDINKE